MQIYLHDFDYERQHNFRPDNFYRNADAVLLTYSVDDSFSLVQLDDWIDEVKNNIHSEEKFVWALIGNKADLYSEIEEKQIEIFLDRHDEIDVSCFLSAKTGKNVAMSWESILETMHEKRHRNDKEREPSTIKLCDDNSVSNRSKCCKL